MSQKIAKVQHSKTLELSDSKAEKDTSPNNESMDDTAKNNAKEQLRLSNQRKLMQKMNYQNRRKRGDGGVS